jgi:hypothetical protein
LISSILLPNQFQNQSFPVKSFQKLLQKDNKKAGTYNYKNNEEYSYDPGCVPKCICTKEESD